MTTEYWIIPDNLEIVSTDGSFTDADLIIRGHDAIGPFSDYGLASNARAELFALNGKELHPVGTGAELAAARDQIAALEAERDAAMAHIEKITTGTDDLVNGVSTLCAIIDDYRMVYQNVIEEHRKARYAARAWKRAAKVYRTLYVSPFPFLEAVESDPDVTRMLFEQERAEG